MRCSDTTAVKDRHAVMSFPCASLDAVSVAMATPPAKPKRIGRCCEDSHNDLHGPGIKVMMRPQASQVQAIFVMATLH